MKAPFTVNPDLTAIAIAYQNQAFIADRVLPRHVVGAEEYEYIVYNKDERFSIPDTTVGRTGRPNEIEFGASKETSSTKDYGLEDPIPQKDIDNARNNPAYQPLSHATTMLSELIGLSRERRVAQQVFAAGNYPTGNKTTLSGTSQWSDFTNSNPIDDIMGALDVPLVRPNTMVIGREVLTKIVQHPRLVKAIHGNSGDVGIITLQQLANLLELDEVMVGASRYNAATKGQTANFANLWGKHVSLFYKNPNARPEGGVTFGWTAQHGSRVAADWFDQNIGLKGGRRVRVGESIDEKLVAADVGYFFENAIG